MEHDLAYYIINRARQRLNGSRVTMLYKHCYEVVSNIFNFETVFF